MHRMELVARRVRELRRITSEKNPHPGLVGVLSLEMCVMHLQIPICKCWAPSANQGSIIRRETRSVESTEYSKKTF